MSYTIDDLTIVITSHQRLGFLKLALSSAWEAGVKHVIVVISGVDEAAQLEITHLRQHWPATKFVAFRNDPGNNLCWLAGVYASETPLINILHDDDLLLPGIAKIPPLFNDHAVGFALWNGISRGVLRGQAIDQAQPSIAETEGSHESEILLNRLYYSGTLSLSPTVGCFFRSHLIRVLKECQDGFGQQFYVRPTMMVGNDLLIWLRAVERYEYFSFLPEPMTVYGNHPGSETVRHVESGSSTLNNIYDATRRYFSCRRAVCYRPTAHIIHVTEDYQRIDPGAIRRNFVARQTWQSLYESGRVINAAVRSEQLNRNSRELGDPRGVPYLRDLICHAMQFAESHDAIMVTNDDTCVVPQKMDEIRARLQRSGCCYCPRYDFQEPFHEPLASEKLTESVRTPGCDLFAFTVDWWREAGLLLPDFLLGSEAWDWVFHLLMDMSQPDENVIVEQAIYHERHDSFWERAENRFASPAQQHNRRLARAWILRNLREDRFPGYEEAQGCAPVNVIASRLRHTVRRPA